MCNSSNNVLQLSNKIVRETILSSTVGYILPSPQL